MRTNAIRLAYPNVVAINGESEAWDQDGNVIEIDEALVAEQFTKLQAEYDSQEYARNRKAEYDALNQLELMTDDSINGTTTHLYAINVIKAKYPKPE